MARACMNVVDCDSSLLEALRGLPRGLLHNGAGGGGRGGGGGGGGAAGGDGGGCVRAAVAVGHIGVKNHVFVGRPRGHE
jgi:hypothetical protein